MLLEHNCSGPTLARSIVGIGINVNQAAFDPALPNPVSMAQLTGRTFDREEVLRTFLERFALRYEQLRQGDRETLQTDYRTRMYRLGERHTYRLPGQGETEGIIEGVRPTGELLVRHTDGTLGEYLFGEIEFVLKK